MKTVRILQNIFASFLLYLVFTGGIISGVNTYFFIAEGVYGDDPEQVSLIFIFVAISLVSIFLFLRLYKHWNLSWK